MYTWRHSGVCSGTAAQDTGAVPSDDTGAVSATLASHAARSSPRGRGRGPSGRGPTLGVPSRPEPPRRGLRRHKGASWGAAKEGALAMLRYSRCLGSDAEAEAEAGSLGFGLARRRRSLGSFSSGMGTPSTQPPLAQSGSTVYAPGHSK